MIRPRAVAVDAVDANAADLQRQRKNAHRVVRVCAGGLGLRRQSFTYSYSTGMSLMPLLGGAIQLAILPTSVTCTISERT